MLSCSWERSYKYCIVEQGTCKGPGEAHSCRRSAHKSTARYRASRQINKANILGNCSYCEHIKLMHQERSSDRAQPTKQLPDVQASMQASRNKNVARQQTRSCPLQRCSVEPSVKNYLFISIKALRDLGSRSTSFTVPHALNSCLQRRRP